MTVTPINGTKEAAHGQRERTKGKTLVELARRDVVLPGGAAEFTTLCDVSETEHICDLVRSAFAEGRAGQSSTLPRTIKELLIDVLDRYIDTLTVRKSRRGFGAGRRMEEAPTLEFRKAAEDICVRLRRGPWDVEEEERNVQALSTAWFKWIAYVASYWMWARMPELLTRKVVSQELGRKGGSSPKRGFQRSINKATEILRVYADLSKTMEARSVASAAAKRVGTTAAYVRMVVKRDQENKKAQRQASL